MDLFNGSFFRARAEKLMQCLFRVDLISKVIFTAIRTLDCARIARYFTVLYTRGGVSKRAERAKGRELSSDEVLERRVVDPPPPPKTKKKKSPPTSFTAMKYRFRGSMRQGKMKSRWKIERPVTEHSRPPSF